MKKLFDNYLKELFSKSNQEQVISVGLMIFKIVLFLFAILLLAKPGILDSNGIWTLITAIFSAPILFLIWRFRDQNATQQIENQRKDINLKEFQKIAEWVSGLHLIEDEITEKSATKDGKQELETTTKYTQQNKAQSIPTFSKRDGAVGLQIAAIHSLLPFFRGEHGESFRRPALNLLTSAWLSLQQKDLAILETINVLKNPDTFGEQIEKIQDNAKSPVGVALTQVLLSNGGDNLLEFPEVFPNLCLAGMDFHLPGLDKKVLSLFSEKTQDCSGINLIGCNLGNANLNKSKLSQAQLSGAKLEGAQLNETELNGANLNGAMLNRAELNGTLLDESKLIEVDLKNSWLTRVKLNDARLNRIKLSEATLNEVDLRSCVLESDDLYNVWLNRSFIYIENLDTTFKIPGAVALCTSDDLFQHTKIILTHKQNKETYTHNIAHSIDLEKTRQENPDWEITIEEY